MWRWFSKPLPWLLQAAPALATTITVVPNIATTKSRRRRWRRQLYVGHDANAVDIDVNYDDDDVDDDDDDDDDGDDDDDTDDDDDNDDDDDHHHDDNDNDDR